MQIFTSILYILTTASLVGSFMLYRKSDKEYPLVTWGFIAWVGLMCFSTLVSGVLTLVHIPVCLMSMAIVNGLASGVLWWRIKKQIPSQGDPEGKSLFQKYDLNSTDFIFMLLMICFVVVYYAKVYGMTMTPAFYVPDGSAHYMEAMRVIRDRNVTDMYYHSINNAILIELFSPVIQAPHFYKAYLFGELINLFLSGISIYCLIRPFAKDRFLQIVSMLLPFAYVMGYPLNNTLYGFVYLGEGITVIAVLILILEGFCAGEIPFGWGVALLCLGCTGIALCYVLFAPMAFFSVFILILSYQKKHHRVFSLRTVWVNLAVFLLPCILALVFAYGGIFATTEETVGGSIAAEGTIYRDLFSNFLPWLPFAIYGFYTLTKQKKQRPLRMMCAFFIVQAALFFVGAYYGLISTYYFYKMHYLMWLIIFALAFMGLALVPRVARAFPVSMLLCWVAVFAMFITNFDGKVYFHNPYLAEPKAAGFFNNLYNNNLIMVAADPGDIYCVKYNKDKLDLLDSAYYFFDEHDDIDMEDFMPVTNWSDSYWVISVLDLESRYFDWWPTPVGYVTKDYKHRMEEADYLLVFTDSDGYTKYGDVVSEGYKVLYSNDLGFLLEKM